MEGHEAIMPSDPIRAYLRVLRERQNISQQKLADRIGVARITWNYYETGKREEGLKSDLMLAAFRELRGSFDDLRELASYTATEAQGVELAEMRAAQLKASSAVQALRQTMSATEFREHVRKLKENARAQQDLLDLLDDE